MPAITSKIGAHVSIAGGVQNAPLNAQKAACETFQCFTRSPQGGPAPVLTDEVVAAFRRNMAAANIDHFSLHAPYYINIASLENRIRHSSITVIRDELERGSQLGASYLMFHPGSYTNQTFDEALGRVHKALATILDGYAGSCKLLIEISAGSGNVLGDTFREVADMMAPVKDAPGFGGVCFDTCHAFASGYDFTTPEAADGVLREFDTTIGLEWLKLTHVNDSKFGLGTHRDRHDHIGKGMIGTAGIAALLRTPAFSSIDWILETESEGQDEDIRALKNIRK
jgi:deoxyribonuclease-4